MCISLSIHSNRFPNWTHPCTDTQIKRITSIFRNPSWGPQHWGRKKKEERKATLDSSLLWDRLCAPSLPCPRSSFERSGSGPRRGQVAWPKPSHSARSPQIHTQHTLISTLPLPFILCLLQIVRKWDSILIFPKLLMKLEVLCSDEDRN